MLPAESGIHTSQSALTGPKRFGRGQLFAEADVGAHTGMEVFLRTTYDVPFDRRDAPTSVAGEPLLAPLDALRSDVRERVLRSRRFLPGA